MRTLRFLGSLLGACHLASGQPYNYGVDIESLTRREDESSRIVIGRLPLSRNGTLPVRPEIRQMKADPYKWDLFILALSMIQYVSQDDPTSWYQIAGRKPCLKSEVYGTTTLTCILRAALSRNTRCALPVLEWRRACRGGKSVRVLSTQLSPVPNLASAILGSL